MKKPLKKTNCLKVLVIRHGADDHIFFIPLNEPFSVILNTVKQSTIRTIETGNFQMCEVIFLHLKNRDNSFV